MKSLASIFNPQGQDSLASTWGQTEAAKEYDPLPRGKYLARLDAGELTTSNQGTPGYKLTFIVTEGEHTGRHIWHDLWLTAKAMGFAKRDLAKIGITKVDQLEKPIPQGYVCEVAVVLHRDDDGEERNRVRSFEVKSFTPPTPDAFAPPVESAP